MATGLTVRHSTRCPAHQNKAARCRCKPRFVAWVYSADEGKKVYKTFPDQASAKSWRASAFTAIRRKELRAPSKTTLREAAAEWLAAAERGKITNRSGQMYKPSVLRGYRHDLEVYLLPELGAHRVGDIQRRDLQRRVEHLRGEGLSPSKIRNALMPLRVIYRRLLRDGVVSVNPTSDLELPAVNGGRERAAAPDEIRKLIEALPEQDRPLWAVAAYAGLRRGELRALRWEDVDLTAGVIRVHRSWDDKAGEVAPKSRKGERIVPIQTVLRE